MLSLQLNLKYLNSSGCGIGRIYVRIKVANVVYVRDKLADTICMKLW